MIRMTGQDLLDVQVALRERGDSHAVATVVRTEGSVSAESGAKGVFDGEGYVAAGWVGGGCADSAIAQAVREALKDGQGRLIGIDMNDEILGTGVPCGGAMEVWVEPVVRRTVVWLVGHGRLVATLCKMASLAGFDVVVNDSQASQEMYPDAVALYRDDLEYSNLTPDVKDFVVIASQHKGDHHSVGRALSFGVSYIAVVASRKRAKLVLESLKEEGFSSEQLQGVVAPAGVDLGGRSPEEIALAITCEIVLLRNAGSGERLSARKPVELENE